MLNIYAECFLLLSNVQFPLSTKNAHQRQKKIFDFLFSYTCIINTLFLSILGAKV